ncbi:MAG: hypothetical protein R3F30_16190 [Planctomycetota bacterium]
MRSALLILAVLVVPLPAQDKPPKVPGGTVERFDVVDREGMYWYLFRPDGVSDKDRYPLVFCLHGNGQKSEGHLRNMAKLSTKERPVFLVVPQYQKGSTFNDPTYPDCPGAFEGILAQALAKAPIDRGRMVLEGFSMGCNFSMAWAYGYKGRHPDEAFPFRAVWLNSTAIPPPAEAPRVPWLLFVGEKERAVLGKIDVVAGVRGATRAFVKAGHDVDYREIPGMGHAVNKDCHELMLAALAALPDWSGLCDGKWPESLQPAVELARAGEFAAFAKALAALQQDESLKSADKAKLRGLPRAFETDLKKALHVDARKLAPAAALLLDDDLARLSAELGPDHAGSKAAQALRDKLAKDRHLAPEFAARDRFREAQKADDPAGPPGPLRRQGPRRHRVGPPRRPSCRPTRTDMDAEPVASR